MISSTNLKLIIGLSMNLFGIAWSVADRLICNYLCKGKCIAQSTNNCTFLLLFVGIIFVVCGYSLIIIEDKRKIKLRRKLKEDFLALIKS